MGIPDDFQFSQANLQDYVDCPRRFQLRHLLQLSWPAVQAEPVAETEHHAQQGVLFHRMVHQSLIGVPYEQITNLTKDEELRKWWDDFVCIIQPLLPPTRYPEVTLSAPFGGYRLLAKYDLIALNPDGSVSIFDWKTSRHQARREWLADRLQSRVYPYLFALAGERLIRQLSSCPEKIEMIYWFPASQTTERFQYSEAQYKEDETYLANLTREIAANDDTEFPRTANVTACKCCLYRSLCDRGEKAGNLNEMDQDETLEYNDHTVLDFDQVAEVEY